MSGPQVEQRYQLPASVAIGTPPSPNWQILAWGNAQDFTLSSATRNSSGVLTSASVTWPDGATGTFTADTINATFNTIDAFHVTYVWGGGTRTFTQAAVTRDANGAVTIQPTPTVA